MGASWKTVAKTYLLQMLSCQQSELSFASIRVRQMLWVLDSSQVHLLNPWEFHLPSCSKYLFPFYLKLLFVCLWLTRASLHVLPSVFKRRPNLRPLSSGWTLGSQLSVAWQLRRQHLGSTGCLSWHSLEVAQCYRSHSQHLTIHSSWKGLSACFLKPQVFQALPFCLFQELLCVSWTQPFSRGLTVPRQLHRGSCY